MNSKILFAKLKSRLLQISHLSSILALLGWDQGVNLPANASGPRASSIASLSAIVHKKFVEIDSDGLLTKLKTQLDSRKLKGKEAAIVSETWRNFDRSRKIPDELVSEIAETTAKAQSVWVEARKHNNFKLFEPWLSKIVKLKRKEAEYVGYSKSPYDALLDTYEPGMTSDEALRILNDLKDFLVPFIKQIKQSKVKIESRKLKNICPIDQQIAFNEMVVKKLGFDFESGRIDKAVHPFASSLHPYDVRITTRYSEENFMYSLGSVIHEAGHGMYEQGLLPEHFGTPLGESISVGIHESQSRMWENLIGKSLPFWRYFFPLLKKQYTRQLKNISLDEFYSVINNVGNSLIRTESDEVTYNLHVILRFEIEKEMIEGSIEIKDLPEIWNEKIKDYFGLDVPSDSLGVLQDVHWSAGLIGYFPTYSFGNLYSAQFFAAMKRDLRNI
ncbi:MAG: carboxypeptidase M32, partial [Candidatus Doudnabacteria bacterium]|nr:carboxypeptidase M32 [Candidatus Doudnabacteria bacterium]